MIPARFLRTCLWALLLSATLAAANPSSSPAALAIKSGVAGTFTSSGTLKIYLEEYQEEHWTIHRIECTQSELSGNVSNPPDARASVSSWRINGCTAYQGSQSLGPAYVSEVNRPSIEAVSTSKVRVKAPQSEPFKLFISYEVGGGRCTDEVEMGTVSYNYTNGSPTNLLSVNMREFFGPAEFIVWRSCLDGGFATVEPKFTFTDPQFEVVEDNSPPPPPPPEPPTVTTGSASVSLTSANLTGTVNSHGQSGSWYFEYGLDDNYGTQVPVPPQTVGGTAVSVGYQISGLKPNTTYHYRLVASNPDGKGEGADKTFRTLAWDGGTLDWLDPSNTVLSGVDCEPASTSMCMAVGKRSVSGSDMALVKKWNGNGWDGVFSVVPEGATSSNLQAVTCPEATSCKAAGSYTTPSGTYSLIEVWDGFSWRLQSSANVTGASQTVLKGISCPAGTNVCSAVGYSSTGNVKTASAQRWDGATWSVQTVPLPSGAAASELNSIDCQGTSFCMAVGRYTEKKESEEYDHPFSAMWNGSVWSLKTVPEPGGYRTESLSDVSCTGTVPICTAVGHSFYPGWNTLVVRWNGTAWGLQATDWYGIFSGIDCSNSNANPCVAVGLWPSIAESRTAAARWDGASWSVEGSGNPGVLDFFPTNWSLADVSCRLATCISVGSMSNSSGVKKTLVMSSESDSQPPAVAASPAQYITRTSARFYGDIRPRGLPTQYHFEYGPTSSYGTSVPVPAEAVSGERLYLGTSVNRIVTGLQPGTTYHFRLVATNAKGTTATPDQTFTTRAWEIQSTPNLAGSSSSYLYDVDCEPASTNACTAVGKNLSGGVDWPLALRWGGSSWSEQEPERKAGGAHTRLFGVDCPSTTTCIAVGNYQMFGSSSPSVLAELWSGNKWSIQSTPLPLGATSSELAAVGCNNAAECMAVGYATISGVKTAIAEEWNSPTWTLTTVPIPSGATSSQLDGVDCMGSGVCVAVGRYTTSGGSVKKLAMLWNGTSWALQSLAEPPEAIQSTLVDVACTSSPNACTAVGSWNSVNDGGYGANKQFGLTYRFNGSTWTLQSTPVPWGRPYGSVASEFRGISCATTTSCTAAGNWVDGDGGANQTFADDWNGSSWADQETPNPPNTISNMFSGISCRGITCLAVGWSTQVNGASITLAEILDPYGPSQPPTVAAKLETSSQTGATLSGDITPNGLSTQYHFEFGTTSSYGTSVPVPDGSLSSELLTIQSVSRSISGLQPGTTYHFRLVATNAKGTTATPDQTFTTRAWEIQPTPNPAEASDSYLYDVSCEPSTSVCTSVGKSINAGVNSPVAQRWNGNSWSAQSPDKKTGGLPTRLFGVDCPSETRCLAVGNYQPSEGGPALLAEIWNEGNWNVQTTPVPSGAASSELVAVGCSWTSECKAVGSAVIGGVKTAIAERWDSPTWTLMTVPIPEGASSSQLDGVDCIWSSVCVAVGRYTAGGSTKSLAMLWNGTSWSPQTLTAPAGAVQSTLLDVSCTKSPTRCTAVGGWKNSAGEQFTLAYRFNGSTWTLQSTPNPSGGIASVFQEVSCATETSCTAAGSWVGGGASNRTLVEAWNGTSWSIQGTPNPENAIFSAFFGISCRSTTCIGVGWSTDGSGVDTTLAETSDLGQPPSITTKPASSSSRTKTTLKGTVNPNGSETTYQFEYGTTTGYGSKAPASPKSIGSGNSLVEVSEGIEGLAPETTYHFRLVATNAKGTTNGPDQTFTTPSWEILSTPNPSGASDSNLYDVSCEPSTSICTAVGKSTISGADSPIAQRWNGTSWSEQSAAKKSGTLPTRLFGVDCPSEARCLAAGSYQPTEGGPTLLAEIWNEGKWSVYSPPIPSGATSSELVSIGCNSTAQCRAAGSAVIGGVKTAIIEAWTSPNWTLMTVPIPEGATSSQLDGIDCIWSSVCVAVGRYTTSGGAVKKLAMLWDGTNWSLQTLADPEGAVQSTLLDVSCTKSPTRCTAVGGWKNSTGEQFTLAYRFNGSTWSLQSTPNPSGATESVFQDVSCATETSCTAAGSSVGGGSTKTLAEKWNGTSWLIQGTPNPSGSVFSSFSGVSCQGTTCMGVGWSTDVSGLDATLGEIRE
jgi:hypothetical protein